MAAASFKPYWIIGGVIAAAVLALFFAASRESTGGKPEETGRESVVPVEVAGVERGPFSLMRTFSGTIEPKVRFTIAPKISGRINRVYVDVADQVVRGQLIMQMEDAEFKQAVIEAEASLAVAEANRVEATSSLEIAQRELDRTKTLFNRGIASESAFDSAQAMFLTSQAAVKVAEANLNREEALLGAARIRLGYTRVQAEWEQGDNDRTVAERFADEGNTVAANTPILSIIEIDPVIAVIQVTEIDYPLFSLSQHADVQTDAFPGRIFTGAVSRISPIFRESSRQARVELEIANPEHLLKPGMFSRCTLELQRVEDTISVPLIAIAKRDNQTGVFRVTEDGTSVEWLEVNQGFTQGERVQLIDAQLSGQVVTLGQQFIRDGSTIRIADKPDSHERDEEKQ